MVRSEAQDMQACLQHSQSTDKRQGSAEMGWGAQALTL